MRHAHTTHTDSHMMRVLDRRTDSPKEDNVEMCTNFTADTTHAPPMDPPPALPSVTSGRQKSGTGQRTT